MAVCYLTNLALHDYQGHVATQGPHPHRSNFRKDVHCIPKKYTTKKSAAMAIIGTARPCNFSFFPAIQNPSMLGEQTPELFRSDSLYQRRLKLERSWGLKRHRIIFDSLQLKDRSLELQIQQAAQNPQSMGLARLQLWNPRGNFCSILADTNKNHRLKVNKTPWRRALFIHLLKPVLWSTQSASLMLMVLCVQRNRYVRIIARLSHNAEFISTWRGVN